MINSKRLKEILLRGPDGWPSGDVAYLMWTAQELISQQEELIRAYEHHIDNDYTISEIKLKCERYSLTSKLMDS